MKSLIIYYSLSDNTKLVAYTLSEILDIDNVEIKDLKDRTGFKSMLSSSWDAMREKKTTIDPMRVDISDYDLIYFGTPVWASKPAPAIITIIDRCDLRGKDVILFATMSSGGGESAIKRMNDKIKARGGRVIESFALKTKGKTDDEIINETEKIIELLDLKMYSER